MFDYNTQLVILCAGLLGVIAGTLDATGRKFAWDDWSSLAFGHS